MKFYYRSWHMYVYHTSGPTSGQWYYLGTC